MRCGRAPILTTQKEIRNKGTDLVEHRIDDLHPRAEQAERDRRPNRPRGTILLPNCIDLGHRCELTCSLRLGLDAA